MSLADYLDKLNIGPIGYANIGGLMLCAATSLHLGLKGRVTGMSGILNGLLTNDKASRGWKLACVAGMLATTSFL